jgi:hypothetical protein
MRAARCICESASAAVPCAWRRSLFPTWRARGPQDQTLLAKLKKFVEWHAATVFDEQGRVLASTVEADPAELSVRSVRSPRGRATRDRALTQPRGRARRRCCTLGTTGTRRSGRVCSS